MDTCNVAVVVSGVRFTASLEPGQNVSMGSESCDIHIPPALAAPVINVGYDGEKLAVRIGTDTVMLLLGQPYRTGHGPQMVEVFSSPGTETKVFDVTGRREFTISPQPGAGVAVNDPGLSLAARREGGRWVVSVSGEAVFVNNVRCAGGRVVLAHGDRVSVGVHDVAFFDREVHTDAALVTGSRLPVRAGSRYSVSPDYPDVRRAPRLIHRAPEEKITINSAPQPDEKKPGQLAKLIIPPLTMVAVTAFMAFTRGNMLFVLTSASMAAVTITFSVSNFFKQRKEAAAKRADDEATYRAYVERKSVELYSANEEQRRGLFYHFPDITALVALGGDQSSRIFEKTRLQFDFLQYRLGLGTVKASSSIEYSDRENIKRGKELDELAYQLYEGSLKLDSVPITSDLMNGPVGYVGPRRLVIEQLQLLINQVAEFHSYHEVQFIMVFPEEERADWQWMRWYRHSSLQEMNVRGFVYDQRSRDQVLSSLNQILKSRQNAQSEVRSGQATIFTPHYVVVILDESLVLDHVIMEFLREDPSDLGCSVIFVQETMSSLADSITTVIDIRDRETGVLVIEQGELKNTHFALDHFPAGFDMDRLPRAIGALNHLQNLKSSIPESVTFLELYEVERFEELGVAGRWAKNSPHRTLGVALGLRGKDDVVKLDLHEKAHGPHGLVAGTTGSGKSEIIQSYILSLAVNFHPHDVAFLLIDYKGGGMANLFSDLPHLLGTITNLDGAQSMRALVSINAELKRRQRVFSENNVNHINQYQKLYKSGDAAEPMPHLFLISDEFAELKAEQPEFMAELVSTARIGRSLGIHLILATQKPSGVVNDQIWSNSKFKLALKVADRADSMEIIKTPDAAEITLPGRAYLQVGNNEIYELFQSAWSGADYEPDKEDNNQEDHTIYAINDLGQYQILNEDLSGLDNADEVKQIATELEAVVQGIAKVAVDEQVRPLPRPWLPPLSDRIFVSDLNSPDYAAAWQAPKSALRPMIGIVDVPSMQAQEPLSLDLSGDGHVAVFASPGYGKSTFLQTVVMDLARGHNPEHLHVYLLDFGTNGLLPLRGLPHVADTIAVDDVEKAQKFITRIESELKTRKQLLSQYAVANVEMFERASGQQLPAILLVLDGFEGLKQAPFDEPFTALLYTIARDGAGLGIHLVLTAGRQSNLRAQLSGNIKTQIVLKLNDDAEARTVVGRTSLIVDDMPGRGLIKLEQPEMFQAALPTAGQDMLQVIEAIQAEAREMDGAWAGVRPTPIPVIPETLELEELTGRAEAPVLLASGVIPVGLDFDTVSPIGFNPVRAGQVAVLTGNGEATARVLLNLWSAAQGSFGAPFVFDGQAGHLRGLAAVGRQVTGLGGPVAVLEVALSELDARMAGFKEACESSAPPTLGEYAQSLDPVLVFVADAATLLDELGTEHEKNLTRLVTQGPAYGMPVILGGTLATAGKAYDDFAKAVKKSTTAIVVGKISDQTVIKPANIGTREPALGPSEGYLVQEALAVRIKLPH